MLLELIQNLGLQTLILGLTTILAFVYIFVLKSGQSDSIPPTPQKAYPVFGHLPMMAGDPRGKINEWAKQIGNIYSIYIGNQLTVVISGYPMLKETLVKKADCFSHRPKINLAIEEYGTSNIGVVNSFGDNWKEQRTVTLNILRSFGMGKSTLADKIDDEVTDFLRCLSELKGEPSDIRLLTNSCVSNIICNIIIGKRFDLDDPSFIKLIHILDSNFETMAKYPLGLIYPWLRHIPGDFFKANMLRTNLKFTEQYFLQNFIDPVINSNDDVDNVDSMVSEYVKEMRKRISSGTPTHLNKLNLLRIITDMFSAGSETTSTTILWFVIFMLNNPDVLKKIQKELDEFVGLERKPSIKDKSKLNYLNACIMETQRCASIVPFSLKHRCTETITIGGYTIPKDSTVQPNLDSVLLDEHIWPDPLHFKPERFLDDTGNLKTFEEFVPFSLGRRACLGESIAKMELFLFLSGICQRFDILPSEDGVVPPLESVFGLTAPPKPYQVRFIERKM